MTMQKLSLAGVLLVALAATTATAQPGGLKLPGGSSKLPSTPKLPGGVKDPTSCNGLSGDAGARIEAFIAASTRLQSAAASLEASVADACKKMAGELKVSTAGGTAAVCNRVATALKAGLKVKATAKSKTVVTYTPAKCTVDASASASASAKCAGGASGTAGTGGSAGSAAGACKANGEATASLDAQCSPPKVDVQSDTSIAVDASAFERASKAVAIGLPALLAANAKAKLAAKSAAAFAASAGGAVKGMGSLAKEFGVQAACVADRMSAAARGAVKVKASVNVSVSASASVSGAAGARAN